MISIDLGSTNSAVCVLEGGKPVVVVNEEGGQTTPSIINLKDGTPKVGGVAKRQMVTCPKETVNLIKRFMGGTYSDVKDAISHVQYDVVDSNGKPRVKIDGRLYSPEELSAMIVRKMKTIAEDYVGDKINDAIITVPAFFDDNARLATKQAGEIAGLNVIRIISEPTAAILASNIDKKVGGKYMVVDFGGSTTDFSIADISDNVIEILSSYGDVYLGGSDIDKILSDYIVETFKAENGVDLSSDAMAMARIVEAAEKAKIELSNCNCADINLPYITAKDGEPLHLITTLSRAKFETLTREIIDKVVSCGKVALERSKLENENIDGILLVGGSCRIPMLQKELIKTFGDKLIKSLNLDLAVAEGAAIQANIMMGGDSELLLLDVVPLSVGIETLGGVMTKLIDANTTIPTRKSQVFSTAADNQPEVEIHVLQGERPMANDCKTLGRFHLDGIAPAPRGIPQIEVTFEVDANGIMNVSAKDKATKKEQSIRIEASSGLSEAEIQRMKDEAAAHAEEDAKTREKLEKANKCESLIFATEQSLESLKEHITDDDKQFFEEKIEVLKGMQKNDDYTGFDEVEKEVQTRWYGISEKAYGAKNGGNPFNIDPSQFEEMFKGQENPFGGAATGQSAQSDDNVEVQDAK